MIRCAKLAVLRAHLVAVLVAVAASVAAPRAFAEEPRTRTAADAYEVAVTLKAKGDFRGAATLFARADELAPSPVALAEALRAAVLADAPALGMTLVERASTRPPDETLAAAEKMARDRFATRAAKIVVRCPERTTCETSVDGTALDPGASSAWTTPGDHTVEIAVDGRRERRSVHVVGGETAEVTPVRHAADGDEGNASAAPPPPAPPPRAPDRATGPSPTLFWIGVGVTSVASALTIASALDVSKKHADFEAAPSDDGATRGQSAETRTNVLLGVTAAAAVATSVLGLVVDWGSGSVTGAVDPVARTAALRVRFRWRPTLRADRGTSRSSRSPSAGWQRSTSARCAGTRGSSGSSR